MMESKISNHNNSDIMKLPDGRKIVRLIIWISRLGREAKTLPEWYEAERKRTTSDIPLYRRQEEHIGELTRLPDAETYQIWRDILRRLIREEHEILPSLEFEVPVEHNIYIDINDISVFSKASGFRNPYAGTEEKSVAASELKSADYLVIGALCDLYWRTKYPANPTLNQSTIIVELAEYGIYGMADRTIKKVLSPAIKAFKEASEKTKEKAK